jgi:hypothetical protein
MFFLLFSAEILPFDYGMNGVILTENESLQKLNMFDFSYNPSWLYYAGKPDYIQFLFSSNNSWGNIKRRFDPEGKHITNFGFSGISHLDEKSTFYGESSYLFDYRSNQNKSLKYDTYSGEAFFMSDSTAGNILYHGPNIGFVYSREIVPGFIGGLELDYVILDGLKSNYSQAQSLIRKISGKLGLVYSFSSRLAVGSTIGFGDTQESIDVRGNELYSADVYNFRGDTYSVLSRGNDINQKIKRKGLSFGSQLYFKPSEKLEFILNGEYSEYHLTNLTSNIETEDGYASFDSYLASLALNHYCSKNIALTAGMNYLYSQSWSKHSILDLLLWKWHTGKLNYFLNLSYKSNNSKFLIDIDYSADYITADSSKLIDKKFNKINTLNHFIMIGASYKLFNNFWIYSKTGLNKINIDPITGDKNFLAGVFNIGAGLYLTQKIYALVNLGYLSESNSNNSHFKKDFNSVLVFQISK